MTNILEPFLMNPHIPAALIAFAGALIVAVTGMSHQRRESNRQREILTRIEAIKSRDSERNKTLKITRDRIIEAAFGAETLTKTLSVAGRNIVKDTAEAFKSASAFFQHAAEVLNGWDLWDEEKLACEEFEKSLTEFFLSLDLDCNFQQDEEYKENIIQKIRIISEVKSRSIAMLRRNYEEQFNTQTQ